MPTFPVTSEPVRVARLAPPAGRVAMVLDTDTFNEIDAQFAVVYSLFSPDRLDVRAIYAAPFHNALSSGPGDGMEKSYAEIGRLLARLDRSPEGFAFKGSTRWMSEPNQPVVSPAAEDLVKKAMAQPDGQPLYVVPIGAPTNVASAILLEPRIIERIVVCWLGGHPTGWHDTAEFNMRQDLHASRVLLDSGVPLVLFPCVSVAEQLRTTLPEIERYVKGRGEIGDYLYEVYRNCSQDHFAYSRVIWDLAPLAWLINPKLAQTVLRPTPILTDLRTWSLDSRRHLFREAIHIQRDGVFRDLFTKLAR